MSERVGRTGRQNNLNDQVAMWPTPSANKITESGDITNSDGTVWDGKQKPHSAITGKPIQTALTDAVKFATPRVSDANGSKIQPNKQGGLGLNQQIGNKLNPDWVEWLMNWPVGWTSLKSIDMEIFTEWLLCTEYKWYNEPDISRVTDIKPERVSRIKSLGDGQVPLVVATAWRLLMPDWDEYERVMSELHVRVFIADVVHCGPDGELWDGYANMVNICE